MPALTSWAAYIRSYVLVHQGNISHKSGLRIVFTMDRNQAFLSRLTIYLLQEDICLAFLEELEGVGYSDLWSELFL